MTDRPMTGEEVVIWLAIMTAIVVIGWWLTGKRQ